MCRATGSSQTRVTLDLGFLWRGQVRESAGLDIGPRVEQYRSARPLDDPAGKAIHMIGPL